MPILIPLSISIQFSIQQLYILWVSFPNERLLYAKLNVIHSYKANNEWILVRTRDDTSVRQIRGETWHFIEEELFKWRIEKMKKFAASGNLIAYVFFFLGTVKFIQITRWSWVKQVLHACILPFAIRVLALSWHSATNKRKDNNKRCTQIEPSWMRPSFEQMHALNT